MKSVKSNVLLLFITLLFITSCSENTPENLESSHTLNFVTDYKNFIPPVVPSITFSDIFSELQLVPLEPKKECMLTRIEKFKVDGDKIFIYNEGANLGVFVFDINGKYLNKIGDIGTAKDEYIYIEDMTIDTENKRVLILTLDNVKMYEYDGKYIATIPLEMNGRFFRIESNEYGYWFASPHTGLEYLLHQYDKDFTPINHYFKISTEMTHSVPTFNNPIQCDGNKVCYYDEFDSKFGVVELGDSISVNTYRFHTGKEKTFKKHQKNSADFLYDEILGFCFAKGKSIGGIVLDRIGGYNFVADYSANTLKLVPNVDGFSNLMDVYSDGYYYAVESPEYLDQIFVTDFRTSKETKELFKKQIDSFKYPISPESNYILVRTKLNDKTIDEYE